MASFLGAWSLSLRTTSAPPRYLHTLVKSFGLVQRFSPKWVAKALTWRHRKISSTFCPVLRSLVAMAPFAKARTMPWGKRRDHAGSRRTLTAVHMAWAMALSVAGRTPMPFQ